MTIEDKVFSRMRFRAKLMDEYGFEDGGGCRVLRRVFMDGDFTAEIMVMENGGVRGRVIDNMNDEEYVQLRMENYTGAYVGTVRAEYEEILRDIAAKCCEEVAFTADQSNRIAAAILAKYSVEPDFPWDDGKYKPAGVFRHTGSSKWFGLVMNVDRRLLHRGGDDASGNIDHTGGCAPDNGSPGCADGSGSSESGGGVREELVDVLNLKADETKIPALHRVPGIYQAYHMNHSKWISVTLDDTLTDEDVMELVRESYRLTSGGNTGVLNERLIREVLEIADSIPPGTVMSYGQIAEAVGRPRNARLVGRIMSMADRYGEHPCHRVVNHAGRTVPGWTEQRSLLEAEGVTFLANGCVDMKKHNK